MASVEKLKGTPLGITNFTKERAVPMSVCFATSRSRSLRSVTTFKTADVIPVFQTQGVGGLYAVPPSHLEAVFESAAVEDNTRDAEPPASPLASRLSRFLAPASGIFQRLTSAAWGAQLQAVQQEAVAQGRAPPAPEWSDENFLEVEEVSIEGSLYKQY